MKIVIDIPEELYETYKGRPPMLGDEGMDMIAQAISNGIPYEERPAEEIEKSFITECRNAAIEQNLPLYFIYYEETGIFDVYVTETKELFEKRHCSKHLPNYKFKEIVIDYLDWYLDWKGGAK